MPVDIRFDFTGDVQLDRTLDRFAARSDDATPAWEALASRFVAAERAQFASQGGYGSGGWAPLAPSYAAWKSRHFPGQPILRATGNLFESLTEGPAVRRIEPHDAWFGTDVGYAGFHQRGDGVPRRRPIELPEGERVEWVRVLQRFLVTGEP